MMSAPPLTTATPQNTTTGMYAPGVVADQPSSGTSLEVVKWSLICVFSIILAFAAATYQYYKKQSALPKAKKAKRKREGKKRKAIEDHRISELSSDPIPASMFLDAYRKKLRKGEVFIEFKGCQKHQGVFPSTEGVKDINRLKNTSNTVPFDHSRVILDELPGRPGSDYINASWIDGYNKPKAYIAAQGPNRSSVGDFWRMIWQVDCRCIVMATNLFEHARQQCEKYWHNTHGRYGSVDVWLESSHFTADFITRTFRIEKAGCEPRTVRQFQIASWSDHDCPNISSVLEYRRVVKSYMLHKPGPIVVHCSKGSGRTGTFISIDALLDEYVAEDKVGIYRMVTGMRQQRYGMVGTKEQYELIYKCVATFIQCGVTVISAKDLSSSVQKMSLKDPKNKINGFEREFKTLQTIVHPLPVGDCAGGHRAENRRKSRDVMLQPPERARPYLMSHENNESTDFINAVYVDGYKNMNAFIVTQWPMKNTMNDIWRLLYDYSITSLVVLNDIPHSRSFPCFWPNEVGERRKFGPVLVELARESVIPGVVSRMFYIKKKLASMVIHERERNDVKVVRMFQLQCWPNTQKVPSSSAVLLELLMLVEDWQNKTNPRNPICVMSKNGVSRCGPFCAIHIAYDKLRNEGEIDIFKAVRTVRLNRPQLVDSITEYIYCYTFMVILLEILDLGQVKLTDRDGNVASAEQDEERQDSQPLSVSQTPVSERGCWSTQLPRAFTSGKPNLSRRRMSRSMEFLPQMLPWLISSDFKTFAKKYKFTYTNPTLTFSDESIEYETSNSMDDVEIVTEPKVTVVGSDPDDDECYDNPSFVSDVLVHNPPGYRSRAGSRRKRKSCDFDTRSLPPDAELRSNQAELERSVRATSVPAWVTVPEPNVPRHSALTTLNKSYPPSPEIKPSDRKTRSEPIFSYSRFASTFGTPKLKEKFNRKQISEEEALINTEQGVDVDDDSSDQGDRSVIELNDIIIQEPEDLVIPRDGDTFATDENHVTLKIDMASDEGSDDRPPDFSSGFGRRGRRGTLVRQSCVTDSEEADVRGNQTNQVAHENDVAMITPPPRRLSPFGQSYLEPRKPMSMLRVGMNYGTLCKQLSKSESGYLSSPSDVESRVDLYRLRSRSETDIRLGTSPKRRKSCHKQYSEECPRIHSQVDSEYMVIEERPKLDKDVVINIPEQGTSDEESDQFFQTRLPLHTSAAKRFAYRRSSLKNRNFSTSSEAEDVDFELYNRAFDELFRQAHGHTSTSEDESRSTGCLSPYTGINEPCLFSSSSEVEDDSQPQRHQTPSRNNSRKHKAKRSRLMRGSSSEPDLEDTSMMGSVASLPEQVIEMTEFRSRGGESTDGEQHSSPGKDSNNSVIHFPVTGEVNV